MRRAGAVLWSISVILLLLVLITQWQRDALSFDSNILNLLPSGGNKAVETVAEEFRNEQSRRVVVVIGHREEALAVKNGEKLRSFFSSEPTLSHTSQRDIQREMYELYFPHRYSVLSQEIRKAFSHPHLLADRVEKLLYSPESSLYSRLIESDPLLLFPSLMMGLLPKGVIMREGAPLLEHGETYYSVAVGMLRSGDKEVQREFGRRMEEFRGELVNRCSDCDIRWSGFSKFSARISTEMEKEASLISCASLVGIVLIVFATFLSLTPLVVTLVASGIGTLLAVVVCEWYFGSLHLITLAFGSTLLGVAADYSFHYLAHRQGRPELSASESLQAIFPGMTNGMITTVLGYGVLCLTPFPFLQQAGLFSSLAALGAYLTVVFLYPYLIPQPRVGSSILRRVAAWYLKVWRIHPSLSFLLIAGSLLLSTPSLTLSANDDLRTLQSLPPDLVKEEREIREILGGDTGKFLIIHGGSDEEVLQRSEALEDALSTTDGVETLTRYIPSKKRQARDREDLRLALQRGVGEKMSVLGVGSQTLERLDHELSNGNELTLSEWLAKTPLEEMKMLWRGTRDGSSFAIAFIRSPTAWSVVEKLDLPGVTVWDTTRRISDTLHRFRSYGEYALLLSYGLIALAFFYRFGFFLGLKVMVPAVLAATSSLGAAALAGQESNIMHMVALMLVLSIGVDYGVYFAEGRGDEEETMTAVLLSAATATVAFAMLLLGSSPLLKNVGLICVVGLSVSVVLSPIATVRGQTDLQ